MSGNIAGSSFRDPCGRILLRDGRVLRQININGKEDYRLLMQSGLYSRLTEMGLLIPHNETTEKTADVYGWKIIEPVMVPFVSYPWEWSFEELRTAALTTLQICRTALEHGMVLKDASAFNIQFNGVDAVFIDTLSFTRYREGKPWIAYSQFCRHFLAPLILGAKKDVRLIQLLRIYLDGIPLDLTVKLIPRHAVLNLKMFIHIYLHAGLQIIKKDKAGIKIKRGFFSRNAMMGLLDSLESAIGGLRRKKTCSLWENYRDRMNYSAEAYEQKRSIVEKMSASLKPSIVWDIGANDGVFSRIAACYAPIVISFDLDHEVIDGSFVHYRKSGVKKILPLITDLSNPTPSCGWAHTERMSLAERGPADCLLALALIHHLAIGNNVSFDKIAGFFAAIARNVIIEFIPKSDSQAARMLSTREDIFDTYTEHNFESSVERYFYIEEKAPIPSSLRIIYRLKNKKEISLCENSPVCIT